MLNLHSLFSLKGHTALITGGNSGLGKSIAYALGSAGAKLLLLGRDQNTLESTSKTFQASGLEVLGTLSVDLTNIEKIQSIGESLQKYSNTIDILVNAAGINARQPFLEVHSTSWLQHLHVHLTAPFMLTQTLAPSMKDLGWGRIINIASLQSYRAFEHSAPYGTAKGGIVQLTRAIAQEWSSAGINCNAIAPGFFLTPLTQKVFDNLPLAKKHAENTCVGRNGELSDIHGLAIFLASTASDYLTGQTIMLDGGYTAK